MRRLITHERLLEENEALRQIIREAARWMSCTEESDRPSCIELLERMRAAIGDKA